MNDEFWMRAALDEAKTALRGENEASDVPIGAVCVFKGAIVARACNRREIDRDPTSHAEILVLREAARALGTSHLRGVSLFVTLEPCPMCAGAIWLARLERLVFGAFDSKAGACGSIWDFARDPRLNHSVQTRGGVLEGESLALLREFFTSRRL